MTFRLFSFLLLISLISLPVFALIVTALHADQSIIKQWMQSNIIWHYSYNTIVLMASTATLSAILGSCMAWLVVYCQFKGRVWLEFCALLPFIMPSWIAAWQWKIFFDYGGLWHSGLKWIAHTTTLPIDPNQWLPSIDNLIGASIILAFSSYPYVYLICRTAFILQSPALFESARSLNCSLFRFYYRLSMPLIRPALAASILVVMMEVLNDFGTVKYFSIPVLALGVEDAWVNRASPATAAALSMITLFIAFLLIAAEHLSRKKRATFSQSQQPRLMQRYQLTGMASFNAVLLLSLPILIGFVIPFLLTAEAAIKRVSNAFQWSSLLSASINSLTLALITALITVATALLLIWSSCYAQNNGGIKQRISYFLMRFASLGYAIPGVILATGVLIPAAYIDKALSAVVPQQVALVGSVALLIYGWGIRFISLAIGNIDSGFSRIRPTIVESAYSLGLTRLSVLRRVYLPLLKGSLLTAGVLVFIDSIKELPIALLVRPFNFELLSIYVWQHGSMEQLEDASPGALLLILIGIVPLLLLCRSKLWNASSASNHQSP